MPAFKEGENYIYYTIDKNGTYHVDPPQEADIEIIGINDEFVPERLDIMKARALNYGYVLVPR